MQAVALPLGYAAVLASPILPWRRRDSNPRPRTYEIPALPLSYAASIYYNLSGDASFVKSPELGLNIDSMEVKKILEKSTLFRGLSEEDLSRLAGIALLRSYDKGGVIFSAEEEARGFYLVAEGMVKIYRLSARGRQQTLHILGPGEAFAEAALFSGSRYPAWAEALTPARVLFFPREAFLDLIRRRPELALNMLALLSLRLRTMAALVDSLSLKEVPERLAAYLLYLLEHRGPEFELEIPKGELAALLGTVPETLSRVLSRFSEEGLIQVSGRQIRILDEEGLRRIGRG